ncbi:hypothetical protein WSM22_31540 [Cytophagales bacterium WSM2-2]|nr:hypothetical protein WSM22_31540 [Cytophagales bacterium WSM2-2]
MKIHFIDMGQGLATLLQFPKGIVLIDAGTQILGGKKESEVKVTSYLTDFFQKNPSYNSTIDAIIVTHNHEDHTGSIPAIAKLFKVKNIVSTDHKVGQDVQGPPAKDKNIKTFFVDYDKVLAVLPNGLTNAQIDPIGDYNGVDPEIKIFSGSHKEADWNKGLLDNPNFHSLAIRVKFGKASFLFIGDMQEESIDFMLTKYEGHTDVFDVDVYQVGHHGSANATTEQLLDEMSPQIAVMSASHKEDTQKGSGFDYGHPNIHIVDMLTQKITGTRDKARYGFVYDGHSSTDHNTRISKKITKKIYCTCWDNTIVIAATPAGEYTVHTGK